MLDASWIFLPAGIAGDFERRAGSECRFKADLPVLGKVAFLVPPHLLALVKEICRYSMADPFPRSTRRLSRFMIFSEVSSRRCLLGSNSDGTLGTEEDFTRALDENMAYLSRVARISLPPATGSSKTVQIDESDIPY